MESKTKEFEEKIAAMNRGRTGGDDDEDMGGVIIGAPAFGPDTLKVH